MVSGFEVVGVVLGAIPIVISFLENYAKDVERLKDFIKYKNMIQKLSLDLNTQKTLFRDTCERLLNGIVPAGTDLVWLLDNPGGPAWQEVTLEKKLKKRLQHGYEHYMELVEYMKVQLEGLRKSLDVTPTGEVCHIQKSLAKVRSWTFQWKGLQSDRFL